MRPTLLFLLLLLALPALAQPPTPDPDLPVTAVISFDAPVRETLTALAFFDSWRLTLNAGETIVVEMQAADGLSPLIGVLDGGQNLVERSDIDRPPAPNSLALLQYTAPDNGEYTIVATREGNQQGTTTGSYTLVVRQVTAVPLRDLPPPAELRCDAMVWRVALVIDFAEEVLPLPPTAPEGTPVEFYRLTVFGLDGFQPVIQASADVREERLDCTRDGRGVAGATVAVAGLPPLTVAGSTPAAQLALRNSSPTDRFGNIRWLVGSQDGAPGRYIAVLEGLALHQRTDEDRVSVRAAAQSRQAPLSLFMLGADGTRLDPLLRLQNQDGQDVFTCDDAGRRGCDTVPALTGTRITLPGPPAVVIQGDRFDAGGRLIPGSTDALELFLASRDLATAGPYTLIFVGELPPLAVP